MTAACSKTNPNSVLFASRISAFVVFTITAFVICMLASDGLSQTRRRVSAPPSLVEVLDQEDRDCVNQAGLERSVTVRSIQLTKGGTGQILVRGSGLCLCGAQNCGFWVYQREGAKYDLLLKGAGANRVRAARTSAQGYRDIVSQSHASAGETIVRTYRYDGSHYHLLRCVDLTYYDDEGKQSRTPRERPCGESAPSDNAVRVPADLLAAELTTIDNRRLKLSDYAGRTLVVTLFASRCAPCRANIPDLNLISRNLKNEVRVIGIVARENDPDLEALRRFTASLNIKFPVVWEEIGFTDSLSNLIQGVHALPQMFIIDNQGRVRKHFRGFNREYTPALVREALDQLRVKDATRTP